MPSTNPDPNASALMIVTIDPEAPAMFSILHAGKWTALPYHTIQRGEFESEAGTLLLVAGGLEIRLSSDAWRGLKFDGQPPPVPEGEAEHKMDPPAFLSYLEVLRVRRIRVDPRVVVDIRSATEAAMEAAEEEADEYLRETGVRGPTEDEDEGEGQ